MLWQQAVFLGCHVAMKIRAGAFSRHDGSIALQVVTGVGKHSQGGKAKLLPAVLHHLNAHDLDWEEEPGNPGQINVILYGAP